MSQKKITIQVQRQDKQDAVAYWETFELPYRPNSNVISCLMEIRKNPQTKEGKKVSPIVWECNCLEEVCGSCTMVINGQVRQSCSSLIDRLEQPIKLQPMSKFPVIRDLVVDRSRMFANLKKVKAWVPVDGYHDLGKGTNIHEKQQQIAYHLSECMTCGCCMEACPQFTRDNSFVGAAAISQVRLFNMNPTGSGLKEERLNVLMQDGGIADCGNAQNCVKVCPKSIPLTESIAEIGKQVSFQFIKNIFQAR